MDSFTRCRVSAIAIQAAYRGFHVRQQWWFLGTLGDEKAKLDMCARQIQTAFALWKLELAVWELKSLCVLLHRGVRAQLDRSVVEYALFHMTCLMRSFASNSYARLAARQEQGAAATILWHRAIGHARNLAAVVIQSYARMAIARSIVLKEFGVSFARGHFEASRRSEIQWAASTIQRAVRFWLQLRWTAIITIQQMIRSWISRREQRRLETSRRRVLTMAAITIQAHQRRSTLRSVFLSNRECAIRIQTRFRKHKALSSFRNRRTSVVSLQRWYRECLGRYESQQRAMQRSVVTLQSFWRMALEQRRLDARRAALADMQRLIPSQIVATVESSSIRLVDEVLSSKDDDLAPCLSRLATSTRHCLGEASASNDAIPALIQDSSFEIPLPFAALSLPDSKSAVSLKSKTGKQEESQFKTEPQPDRAVPALANTREAQSIIGPNFEWEWASKW